ncbi:MAG: HRDC domain-containing protein [Corynebacterium sp.]|uniref:HRDC domain-containing protein n=1 Tax=Corynebacterium sp. TaxID=1720 RepID=UPI0026DAC52F|nr:HRDC domain-containing protein [Corynebacterium sp.]MDO4760689.1 HRDC domain-containing protein [Corynebacterium sp.]
MPDFLSVPRDGVPLVSAGEAGIFAAADVLALGHGPFAVDTERASGFRYDDRAFLLQIRRAGAGTVLIDVESSPSATTAALQPVLGGADWIIHAAPSDLPCLSRLDLYPGRLFDTELAGRLLGHERVNLAAMVNHYCGVDLAKGHGAEDWSKRPLPQEWLAYAALDVECLLDLARAMAKDLKRQNKVEWADQECAHIQKRFAHYEFSPKTWLDLKGLSNLRTPMKLAVAKHLWEVRDLQARSTDTAPSALLPDRALVALAAELPTAAHQVMSVKNYPPRLRKSATMWAREVRFAKSSNRRSWPKPAEVVAYHAAKFSGVPDKRSLQADYPVVYSALDRVKTMLDVVAEKNQLPLENLISPSDMRTLVWQIKHEGLISSRAQLQTAMESVGVRPWQQELCMRAFLRIL